MPSMTSIKLSRHNPITHLPSLEEGSHIRPLNSMNKLQRISSKPEISILMIHVSSSTKNKSIKPSIVNFVKQVNNNESFYLTSLLFKHNTFSIF